MLLVYSKTRKDRYLCNIGICIFILYGNNLMKQIVTNFFEFCIQRFIFISK